MRKAVFGNRSIFALLFDGAAPYVPLADLIRPVAPHQFRGQRGSRAKPNKYAGMGKCAGKQECARRARKREG